MEHRLHSRLDTWLWWIGQRQLQDEARKISVLVFSVTYIRGLTVVSFEVIRNVKLICTCTYTYPVWQFIGINHYAVPIFGSQQLNTVLIYSYIPSLLIQCWFNCCNMLSNSLNKGRSSRYVPYCVLGLGAVALNGYFSGIRLKPKFRDISFVQNLSFSRQIVSIFCTEYHRISVVLYVKFQNEMNVMDQQNCAIFEIEIIFGEMSFIAAPACIQHKCQLHRFIR